jgi:hypothetical protein
VEGSPHFFAGSLSAFCPGLDVNEVDGEFQVKPIDGGLEAVVAAATLAERG